MEAFDMSTITIPISQRPKLRHRESRKRAHHSKRRTQYANPDGLTAMLLSGSGETRQRDHRRAQASEGSSWEDGNGDNAERDSAV